MTERPDPTDTTDTAPSADTELLMTQHDDPTADPVVDPTTTETTAETTSIELVPTQAVPAASAQSPFRVEPAVPVPDDATSERVDPSAAAPAPSPGPTWHGHQHSYGRGPHSHHRQQGSANVTVRKGPRPGAVVLGLLSMIVAAYVISVNVTDADLEFRVVGPVLVGALGGLLLLVGLAGVIIGRLRR